MDLSKLSEAAIKDLLATGATLCEPKELPGGRTLIIRPSQYESDIIDPEPHEDMPRRVRAVVAFTETESFIQYLKTFKEESAQVFCNRNSAKFSAVLDYHGKDHPSWGEHRAYLTMQRTKEWSAWLGVNNKPQTQQAFAEFLEDQAPWVTAPVAASFMEMVLNLEEKAAVTFKSSIRLQDGSRTYQFADDKGEIKIPDRFTLTLAAFEGTTPQDIQVRLRYRATSAGVTFVALLVNPEIVERNAIAKAVDEIEEATGLKVLFGGLEKMGLA